jgi:ferredoxin
MGTISRGKKRAGETNKGPAVTDDATPGPRKTLKNTPVIDRSECTDCESCISLLPGIFKRNPETGCIEVVELPDYPENEIAQVMSMCPGDCIAWQ